MHDQQNPVSKNKIDNMDENVVLMDIECTQESMFSVLVNWCNKLGR